MNCPQCGNRNPSTAKHCLHCNTVFEEDREGLFEASGETGGSGTILTFGVVIAAIIGGAMFFLGFDTYDSKCVTTESAAAEYESKPEWEHDEAAERRYHRRQAERYKKRTGKRLPRSRYDDVWCFRQKTGHVDGVVE